VLSQWPRGLLNFLINDQLGLATSNSHATSVHQMLSWVLWLVMIRTLEEAIVSRDVGD
jgi:hypothetical protein